MEQTAMVLSRIHEIDRKDEEQIMAHLAGEVLDEYVYSFQDARSRRQTGLSWVGARELAQLRGNILVHDHPEITEADDHWRVVVRVTDLERNVTVLGGTHQPKKMKVYLRNKFGEITYDLDTGEALFEMVDDDYAFEKALSKAQRNAIKTILPEAIIKKAIQLFLRYQKTGRSPSQKDLHPASQKRGKGKEEEAAREEAPPQVEDPLFFPRKEAIEEIEKFFEGKGWVQPTREAWLLKAAGYRTLEECPDELLAKALKEAESIQEALL